MIIVSLRQVLCVKWLLAIRFYYYFYYYALSFRMWKLSHLSLFPLNVPMSFFLFWLPISTNFVILFPRVRAVCAWYFCVLPPFHLGGLMTSSRQPIQLIKNHENQLTSQSSVLPNWKLVSGQWLDNAKNQTATMSKILPISVAPIGKEKGICLLIKYLGVTVQEFINEIRATYALHCC